MHFVWRHSSFTVIVHTIVKKKTSDAKIESEQNENFAAFFFLPHVIFNFSINLPIQFLEKRKLIVLRRKKFTENSSKYQLYCTTMAPRRAKKAAPTVQAEAVVADTANDAAPSNGIDDKSKKTAKATKSAPATKSLAKKAAASKKNAVEKIEEEEQQQPENGGGDGDVVENVVVEPVVAKVDAKSKKAGASKKNAKATEQNDDAGKANGQTTNGDAPDGGKKRAAKGKQKKTDEVVAVVVKETKAAKGKPKKIEQETDDDDQNEPEPGPSKMEKTILKGKSTKKIVEPVDELTVAVAVVPVEARGRRGAKKVVTPEEPVEIVKPVKRKGKKVETVKSKSKPKEDEPVDQTDDVEENVAPAKGRKRVAPAATAATEKSPAKKGKKDTAAAAAVAGGSKTKANGASNKKRKAGVKAAADSTTTESDGELITKRKKGSKEEAPAESKMNPTASDLSQIDFEADKEHSLKIVSWNVAGLRALVGKNGFDYFEHEKPDIICLQV